MTQPQLTEREHRAWALYCRSIAPALRRPWHELAPTTQKAWLAEADRQEAKQ